MFCNYTKEKKKIKKWVVEIEQSDAETVLEYADKYVYGKVFPEAITLGFSPQILIASLCKRRSLTVITSSEVLNGSIRAAIPSHRVLMHFKDYVKIYEAPFAPSSMFSPSKLINRLAEILIKLRTVDNLSVLDISGGTQLVPLAALKAGYKCFTYAYPNGRRIVFHEIKI